MKLFPLYDDNIGNRNHKEEIVMKKFALGIIVGALLFGAMPAFADTVSNLLGKKVEGVYAVQTADGKKIADAAVINGSTYAPVRAVAEATGINLTVEGKVIILSDNEATTTSVAEFEVQKNVLNRKIKETEGSINLYETDILPRATEKVNSSKGTDREQERKKWLDERTSEYEQYKTDLTDLKNQLTEIDNKISELQK